MDLPKRKPTRLNKFNYSADGAYFLTICTKERKEILGKIETDVGFGACDELKTVLSAYGLVAEKYIQIMSEKMAMRRSISMSLCQIIFILSCAYVQHPLQTVRCKHRTLQMKSFLSSFHCLNDIAIMCMVKTFGKNRTMTILFAEKRMIGRYGNTLKTIRENGGSIVPNNTVLIFLHAPSPRLSPFST